MKTIQVSDEVYSMLQGQAQPFEDTPEDVIRRLLNGKGHLAELSSTAANGEERERFSAATTSGTDLVSTGGRIRHGTKLRAIYKGVEYSAEVRDGRVIWNNKGYTSLSAAAIAVIQSTGSPRPTEDGWRFWKFWSEEDTTWVSRANLNQREK